MKKFNFFFCIILLLFSHISSAQKTIDSLKFFTDEDILEMTLTTDIRGLQRQKGDDVFQDGTVKMKFSDKTEVAEKVAVGARGKFRRENCRIPPIMINFHTPGSALNNLGKLKLVISCGPKSGDEELLFKEYLIYKIYNLLEKKSFRVRLLKVNYEDASGKNKPFTQHAFLIEDDGDLARRNGCKKKEHPPFMTQSTDRELMTMVAVFEYFIGNTDWSVPNNHNIKLIFDRKNDAALPFPVAYDFDYCGLVDASYAIPNEVIGTEKVTERVYRGFPRTLEEIQTILKVFKNKKESIYNLINNFTLLSEKARKVMTNYLEDFYRTIDNSSQVKTIFIENARKS
ncbi:MAG: hypothetical protein ABIP79_04580 [Chitinophagaceae bacterium]